MLALRAGNAIVVGSIEPVALYRSLRTSRWTKRTDGNIGVSVDAHQSIARLHVEPEVRPGVIGAVEQTERQPTIATADVEDGRGIGQPVAHEVACELVGDVDQAVVILAHEPKGLRG